MSIRALVLGGMAGFVASCGFRVVDTITAPLLLLAAVALVWIAPPRERRLALVVAVSSAGAVRAILLIAQPVDSENGWLILLAVESAVAAIVALRWPAWGAAVLILSTALHRARVVETTWRADELPLALTYGVLASAALAIAVRSRSQATWRDQQ